MTTIVNKPWGYEEIWAEAPSYLGKILVINPGHKLSRQYHNFKEETFRVLLGTLRLQIGSDEFRQEYILKPGDVYHCIPGTIHRMICDISEPRAVQVMEVSTNYPNDVVRLEDDYRR